MSTQKNFSRFKNGEHYNQFIGAGTKVNSRFQWKMAEYISFVFLLFFLATPPLSFSLVDLLQKGTLGLYSEHNSGIKRELFRVNAARASAPTQRGEVLSEDRDNVNIPAGERKEYTVRLQNTGEEEWSKGEVTLETGPFLRSASEFKDKSWKRYFQPQRLEESIAPGEVARLSFYLQAPSNITGVMQQQFQLVSDNRPIPGAEVTLFINITEKKEKKEESTARTQKEDQSQDKQPQEEKKEENKSSSGDNKEENTKEEDSCVKLSEQEKDQYERCNTDLQEEATKGEASSQIKEEPLIRVGVFRTGSAERVRCNGYFDVYAGEDLMLSGVSPDNTPSLSYNKEKRKYYINISGITKTSDSPIRIVPRNKSGVVELVDHQDRPSWNPGINYNKFRNTIEFNYSPEDEEAWIINELPMSSYIKGLAETTDYSPKGFQKAIATIARTYAMYHYQQGKENGMDHASTKHEEDEFHVDATYDQVYKGYVSEKQMPQYSQAVEETVGKMVTYEDNVVVTPYFSQSDGRTRAWEEVWYGSGKPWLKSVSVPQEEGEELWGHGVGLSARGALLMIREEGHTWKETLKYFYQGIQLKDLY